MVGSLSTATMRTLVSGALAPSLEISSGGKCVKKTVDDEFHCAFWKIKTSPDNEDFEQFHLDLFGPVT